MPAEVFAWWLFLRVVAGINLVAWAVAAGMLARRRGSMPAEEFRWHRLQLLLSAGYVAGCAFRSAFPVFDVPRLGLVDSWLSSAFVGRSVSTVAELCFALQWALLGLPLSRALGVGVGVRVSQLLVPAVVVAEVCSWYAVLSTNNLGHMIEESIWGVCALLMAVNFTMLRARAGDAMRPSLTLWAAAGAVYAAYMFLVDVPMYATRWIADEANGRAYLGLAEGAVDAARRWTVSHHWEDWHTEAVWMSLYFSVAVWISIALVHAPVLLGHGRDRTC